MTPTSINSGQNEFLELTRKEKNSLFIKGLIFTQLHPVSIFALLLFMLATGVLFMHLDNIRYNIPLSGGIQFIFLTVTYLLFSSYLYSTMIKNEIRGYQFKLKKLNKLNSFSPSQILDFITSQNHVYAPVSMIFWITLATIVASLGLGGEANVELAFLLPVPFILGAIIAIPASIFKKKKIDEFLGLS